MNPNPYFGLKELSPDEIGPDDEDVISRYAGRIESPMTAPIEIGMISRARFSDEYTAEIVPGPQDDKQADLNHTESNTSTPNPEGPMHPIPPSRWVAFFSSPQGYVITATVAVLLAGAAMYTQLDSKISAIRLESKTDSQYLEQRLDKRFDKTDSSFDKIDARFDVLLNKIDADARETRSLIRGSASTPGNAPAR